MAFVLITLMFKIDISTNILFIGVICQSHVVIAKVQCLFEG